MDTMDLIQPLILKKDEKNYPNIELDDYKIILKEINGDIFEYRILDNTGIWSTNNNSRKINHTSITEFNNYMIICILYDYDYSCVSNIICLCYKRYEKILWHTTDIIYTFNNIYFTNKSDLIEIESGKVTETKPHQLEMCSLSDLIFIPKPVRIIGSTCDNNVILCSINTAVNDNYKCYIKLYNLTTYEYTDLVFDKVDKYEKSEYYHMLYSWNDNPYMLCSIGLKTRTIHTGKHLILINYYTGQIVKHVETDIVQYALFSNDYIVIYDKKYIYVYDRMLKLISYIENKYGNSDDIYGIQKNKNIVLWSNVFNTRYYTNDEEYHVPTYGKMIKAVR